MKKIRNKAFDRIRTFNPVVGCNIGCSYCYARRFNKRYKITPEFSVPTYMEYRLHQLYGRKGNVYLANSMSDLSGWQDEWREEIFKAFKENQQHIFLLLTKRPGRMFYNIMDLPNVWMGTTVTTADDAFRIEQMTWNVDARHYWVCVEPLFEDVGKLDLSKIDWIVIGPESGPRKVDKIVPEKRWVMNIVKQAREYGIPVAMKEGLEEIVGPEDFRCDVPASFEKILAI